ncbi:MAG: type II toxin-antitoxin system HicA family toxin [Gammaproteobacteria bacterium]
MSEKLPVVSGKAMVEFLEARGFWQLPRTGGSHIVMTRDGMYRFSVPDHKELRRGTATGILRQAGISREEFFRHFRRH